MGKIADDSQGAGPVSWPGTFPEGQWLALIAGLLNRGFGQLGQPTAAGNVAIQFDATQPKALPNVAADRLILNNNSGVDWNVQRIDVNTGQLSGPLFTLSAGQAKTYRAFGGNLKNLAIQSSAGTINTVAEWELGGF